MGPGEFEEWEAFHYFEPFGSPVEDQRTETLATLTWYAGNFKGDPPEFFDRDWQEKARLRAEAEAALTLEDKLIAFLEPRVADEA